MSNNISRAHLEGALIEVYDRGWNIALPAMVSPYFDFDNYEYRIKGNISIRSWDAHKDNIMRYWAGEAVEFEQSKGGWKEINGDVVQWSPDVKYRPKRLSAVKDDEFMKDDGNKNRLELIEPAFIKGLGKVLTLGAEKYDTDNWKKVDDKGRYKGAMLRHVMAYLDGEERDPETGLSHLYHAQCNMMFLDYFDRMGE